MAFVSIAFDGSTKTQYATWRANLRLLFWAQEGNESELFVALKLLNITVWNEHLLCNSEVYHKHGCKFNVQMQRI